MANYKEYNMKINNANYFCEAKNTGEVYKAENMELIAAIAYEYIVSNEVAKAMIDNSTIDNAIELWDCYCWSEN